MHDKESPIVDTPVNESAKSQNAHLYSNIESDCLLLQSRLNLIKHEYQVVINSKNDKSQTKRKLFSLSNFCDVV